MDLFSLSFLAAAGLVGYWLRARLERRPPEVQDSQHAVNAALQELREEHARQIEALHERLDFAERMLAQRQLPPAAGIEHATPA